jgi:hypothetical protein
VALTTHTYLAPRLKKEWMYTSTPPLDLSGLFLGELHRQESNQKCDNICQICPIPSANPPQHTANGLAFREPFRMSSSGRDLIVGAVDGTGTIQIVSSQFHVTARQHRRLHCR